MTDAALHLTRRLRAVLDAPTALATALRLLLVRRLELEGQHERARIEAAERDELAAFPPEEREQRVRALLRDRLRSSPRKEDTLGRIASLAEPARAEACVAFLGAFSGAAGERLRNAGACEAVRKLGAAGALGSVLEDVASLALGPDRLDEAAYAALERAVADSLRGADVDPAIESAWRIFAGFPGEDRLSAFTVSSPEVEIEVDHDRKINWAMEHNGIPIVHAVRVRNRGEAELTGLAVALQVGPGLSGVFEAKVPPLPAGGSFAIDRPDIRLDSARLQAVVERERSALHVEVRDGKRLLLRESRPVEALAFNEWDRTVLPELLAAFVLPNDPAVARILETARDLLRDATGDPSLSGYQARSRERVRAVVDCVYRALQRLDVTCVTPPASFDAGSQKLRFPGQVLEHRMGACADLTVLLAACLEGIGLNPVLVTVKGHALPGAWLVDDWLPVASTDDPVAVRKLVAAGELLLFDASAATLRPPVPLAGAERSASACLADAAAFEQLVDVKAARIARIFPLPIRAREGERGAAEGSDANVSRAAGSAAEADGADATLDRPRSPATPRSQARSQARPQHARIERWKERLLDLSLRNRLLNFRESREKSVALDTPELSDLEDRLASGELLGFEPRVALDENDPRVAELLRARGSEELMQETRAGLLRGGRILTKHADDDLSARLLAMFRAARTELEETGSSTLYLAIGILRWSEAGAGTADSSRLAPVLLYPVELVRPTARTRPRMRLRDDEPRLNDTLLEKLRVDFGLELPELKSLPTDENGVDVATVLMTLRRGIARAPRFDVLDEAHLAFFSFAKFLMWRDLDQHQDDLLKNALVRHLALGAGSPWQESAGFLDPRDLDREMPPSRSRLVLDADSSQHVAVDAALKGKTFVLQGPPGTGKSQTIANIIAECLAAGKRVLFVAEKRVALEVVAKRLRAAGLGSFCLELHSNKANKRGIVLELGRVLDGAGAPASPPSPGLGRRVEEQVGRLNGYASALHASTPLGLSRFSCAARLLELDGAPRVDLEIPEILPTEKEAHEGRLESLASLAAAASELPRIGDHPFAACAVTEWTALRARQWEAELRVLERAAASLESSGAAAARLLDAGDGPSVPVLESLAAVLDLLAEGAPGGCSELCRRRDAVAALERLGEALNAAKERASLLEELSLRFDPGDLFKLDLDDLLRCYRKHAERFALIRWMALRRPRTRLGAVTTGKLPPAREVVKLLERAVRCRELGKNLDGEQPLLAELIGAAARGAGTPIATLERLESFARRWLAAVDGVPQSDLRTSFAGPPPVDRLAAREAGGALAEALAAFRSALSAAGASLSIEVARAFGGPDGAITPARVVERARSWLAEMLSLRAWARFTTAEASVRACGLAPITQALRAGALTPGDLAPAYERAFLERWLEHSVESAPELRGFNGREHDRVVDGFRRGDRALIEAGGQLVAAALGRDRPVSNGTAVASSEVGILQREARKKTRHMSVRRLLEQIPNLLPRLKPCLLMSPLSIAQYLPPGREPFDLVIFDEASQIPTADAIGAIARGCQVVVVGDSKQLPPTAFFTTAPGEDDDPSSEGSGATDAVESIFVHELESILDECVASQIPSILLRWHYRSRDERLITFSNRHYYEGRLLTFPAAGRAAGGAGVSVVPVKGEFERGKTRTNRTEAEAVVRWIVEALRDPVRRTHSIGVVTFNHPQQSLVEDLLDRARREHPEIEPYFGDRAPEPVFVKNLENVQGDERDVILFSVAFAPDSQGRLWMNFGALNVEGGERRLNVAITRARLQLVVFTALRPEMIDLSRTRARGVEHLKSFLRYAETAQEGLPGDMSLPGGSGRLSPLEEDVALRLQARGHTVDRQVGCSGYRIDLAVKDPDDPCRHLLGVECDGVAYRDASTARDRDRLRRSVLETLGWRLHRVWSLDWRHDPEAELRRIEEALAKARVAGAEGFALPGANAELRSAVEAPPAPPATPEELGTPVPGERGGEAGLPGTSAPDAPSLPPYEAFAARATGTPDSFEKPRADDQVMDLIAAVVRHEGPLHRDVLFRRVAHAYGIARLTKSVEDRIVGLLDRAAQEGKARVQGIFVWPHDADPAAWTTVRGPSPGGELREPEHVPPEEMAAAAELVLRSSVALTRTDLARGAATLMGYRRATPRVREAFESGIDALAARGGCVVEGDSIREARGQTA